MSAIPFQIVLEDSIRGPAQAVAAVVGSDRQWDALGAKAQMPKADFGAEVLLVVALGTQPDLRFRPSILLIDGSDGADASDRKITVTWERREDGPGSEAIGKPMVVAKIPAAERVVFVEVPRPA